MSSVSTESLPKTRHDSPAAFIEDFGVERLESSHGERIVRFSNNS